MKIFHKIIKTTAVALMIPFCLLLFTGCGERRESTREEVHEEMQEDGQMMQEDMHEDMMHDSTMHDTTMHNRR